MANPRKFSEKIALQKQKQAEGTAEFEKIMNEVKATRVLENPLNNTDGVDCVSHHGNTSGGGGSGGSGTSSGASGGGASPDANPGGGGGGSFIGGGSPAAYRESRGRSMGVGPMRRPSERKQDRSPYGSTAGGLILSGITHNTQNSYLSPPMDTSWRRSNSDSALHQTLNMAEGNFGTSPQASLLEDLNNLHANYSHHQNQQQTNNPHHNSQRSHSPNIGRSYSPQAQKRKNTMLQQQQQQQQLHQRIQIQQQQQAQHHHQLQQHLQNQQLQQQHHMQQQQQCNAKFNNTNMPGNGMNFSNTGSLPDLTSVHFATVTNMPQLMQTQTLSPIVSPNHNNGCHERDQSSSPFSPTTVGGGSSGGIGGCGPSSPYHQQECCPTSAANTSTSNNQQSSPHLSFTNLSVQSPVSVSQQNNAQNPHVSFSTLPTLGAASSTGNLTDYRQPLNPPSPGSSPGLLTSGTTNDIHTSAPASPIRHCQNNQTDGGSSGNRQNQQIQPTAIQQTSFGAIDSNQGYNSLHPAFHNHFEQFNLGDSCQSPQNTYDTLDFEEYVVSATTGNQQSQQHHAFNSKLFDLEDLTSSSANTTKTHNTNTTTNCSNNNNNNLSGSANEGGGGNSSLHGNSQHFQHINNNKSASTTNENGHTTCRSGLMNNNDRQDILSANSSPIPSPISHCVPSPSSPLPIPMSSHSPAHHQQLSLSVQTSPHHSPLHSPHHTPSPLSVSSPGLTMMGSNISPLPSPSANILNHRHLHNHMNSHNSQHLQHGHVVHNNSQHQTQQSQAHTPTTATNIPQIIFSDYSSRDIFDNLDLDLGQIDEPGLQMLSDQNPIMIADPSIEDSFRRDLN